MIVSFLKAHIEAGQSQWLDHMKARARCPGSSGLEQSLSITIVEVALALQVQHFVQVLPHHHNLDFPIVVPNRICMS